MTDELQTWGRVWALELERLHERHAPALPWLEELVPVSRRMAERAAPAGERFRRIDTPTGRRVQVEAPPQEEEEAPLPWDIRQRLRRLLGSGADAVQAHQGDRADALARSHRADAVTVGKDVYFAHGKLQPHSPEGFALLAHEATHVVASGDPNVGWHRNNNAGAAMEEQRALRAERTAMDPRAVWTDVPRAAPIAAPVATPPAAQPTATDRPMTAAIDRSLEDAPSPPGGPDIGELKRVLFRELLRELRSDFERGG